MAFSQKVQSNNSTWGVAPGYGERGLWPKKQMKPDSNCSSDAKACSNETDRNVCAPFELVKVPIRLGSPVPSKIIYKDNIDENSYV